VKNAKIPELEEYKEEGPTVEDHIGTRKTKKIAKRKREDGPGGQKLSQKW